MPAPRWRSWIERARSDGEEIPEPLGRVEVAPKTGRAGRRQERIDKRRRRREKGRRERRDAAGGVVPAPGQFRVNPAPTVRGILRSAHPFSTARAPRQPGASAFRGIG